MAPGFLDYLDKGNRVLFRLRDLEQLQAVARMAYDQSLSFEFDRVGEGISTLIFKRGIKPGGRTVRQRQRRDLSRKYQNGSAVRRRPSGSVRLAGVCLSGLVLPTCHLFELRPCRALLFFPLAII